jgi:hypothetical protein
VPESGSWACPLSVVSVNAADRGPGALGEKVTGTVRVWPAFSVAGRVCEGVPDAKIGDVTTIWLTVTVLFAVRVAVALLV